MFIAIVQIPMAKRPRDAAVDAELTRIGLYWRTCFSEPSVSVARALTKAS